jgi:TatD DNase family protein
MQLVDTHCHIHEIIAATHGSESHNGSDSMHGRWKKSGRTAKQVIDDAVASGVEQMICVGCTLPDSQLAVEFAKDHPNVWASIGIHPHEAKDHLEPKIQATFAALLTPQKNQRGVTPRGAAPAARNVVSAGGADAAAGPPPPTKIVAVGECGLDYYYTHSPKKDQEKILRFQMELALEHNVPMIFHVRDAFEDFWPIFDEYKGLRGVIHSFSASRKELDQIVARGLYVGLNGIMTFTKDQEQLAAAKTVPLERLLLETDAPFLTPAPHRGTICQPKHVCITAEFLANLREESLDILAKATTANARELFGLED